MACRPGPTALPPGRPRLDPCAPIARRLVRSIAGAMLTVGAYLSSGLFTPAAMAANDEFTPEQLEHFEKKIRPLLVSRCGKCHGEEADEPAGGLSILSRKLLLDGGDTGPSIEPGSPDDSLLIRSIRYGGDYEMPPDSKLPDDEIRLLEAWVADGAPWPSSDDDKESGRAEFDLVERRANHWCWKRPGFPIPPTVTATDWPRDPLDRFVLAKLEQAGIGPADDADRATWLRRVTFDLTGLPPTIAEWEAFRDDDSDQAYARVVDRLLESPRFGERWARHWLDLVRYAETCGHEFDYPIPGAHHYRDYLIRAFNADVPYDRFVLEHLAGDLLPDPRRHPTEGYDESIIGTGFWFLGEATHAPVDSKGDEAGRIDNQLDVMSKTFLGLTVACARCHDHKFDAISTRDYYAMSGFLQSSRRQLAPLDPGGRIAAAQHELAAAQRDASARLTALLRDSAQRERLKAELTELLAAAASGRLSIAPGEENDTIVLADFEDGSYQGWTAEGEAFGSVPQSQATLPGYQGEVGASGRYFINSHSRSGADGSPSDEAVGTLTSPEFVIERRYLHFLIGGGPHVDRTCVQVLVDGMPVASRPGFAENAMRPVYFDLDAWRGKRARIQVIDQESGGWGNIGADRFVLSDRESLEAPISDWSRLTGTSLAPERAARWGTALGAIGESPVTHPAGPIAEALRIGLAAADCGSSDSRDGLAESIERSFREGLGNHAAASERYAAWESETLAPPKDDRGVPQLFRTGQAFDASDEPTAWIARDGWEPAAVDVVASDRLGARAWGAVRTPDFTIDKGAIWYLIRARDVELRVVVDGYVMHVYSGLLFSDLTKRIDTGGEWQWVSQAGDLSRYLGHRAHLEVLDQGAGSFELAAIRFSDGPPPSEPLDPLVGQTYGLLSTDEMPIAERAEQVAALWFTALDAVASGSADRRQADLVRWLVDRGLIEPTADERQALDRSLALALAAAESIPEPLAVQAMTDGSAENEAVFVRGNHRLLGETVPRRDLESLVDDSWPELPGSGRLEWAKRTVAPDHPLTSRVIVNRLWHHLFGRGIVPTVDNFGVLGELPSDPELLDHLAVSFVDDGWSIKRMIRRMVLSRTYRQSSRPDPVAEQVDPTNRLWHRMEVRRLEGEALRDAMLAISGRLDATPFGPPVPIHLTAFMQGRGRPGSSGPLDGSGRRSIYQEVRRNFLSPMMLAFDTPIPFSTVGRRNVSNVPAQALILLNDPFVHEQAAVWAERLVAAEGDPEKRLERAFLEAFCRAPSDDERRRALEFLASQAEASGLDPNVAPNDVRVWTDLLHALWNVKSFAYLD